MTTLETLLLDPDMAGVSNRHHLRAGDPMRPGGNQ